MLQEVAYYHSSRDSCECGENMLLASIAQLDIPFIHRIQLGAAFPDLPPLHLNVTQQWRNLHVEFELLERENHQPIEDPDYYDKSDASAFANSYPISVIQTINDGVTHFSKLKNEDKLKLE